MTIRDGLLPVLTEVRKIRYGKRFDYDDLVETLVSKTDVSQTMLAVKLNKVMTKKDSKSEIELLKFLFVN